MEQLFNSYLNRTSNNTATAPISPIEINESSAKDIFLMISLLPTRKYNIVIFRDLQV